MNYLHKVRFLIHVGGDNHVADWATFWRDHWRTFFFRRTLCKITGADCSATDQGE